MKVYNKNFIGHLFCLELDSRLSKYGSGMFVYHLSAFFRAAPANLRTMSAMVCIVLFTFFGAGITDFCTHITESSGEVSAYRHQLRCCSANGSTLPVELNTTCHHLDIIFPQTFGGAMFALSCA